MVYVCAKFHNFLPLHGRDLRGGGIHHPRLRLWDGLSDLAFLGLNGGDSHLLKFLFSLGYDYYASAHIYYIYYYDGFH